MLRTGSRMAELCLSALCLYLSYWVLRSSYADYLVSRLDRHSLDLAAALVPGRADTFKYSAQAAPSGDDGLLLRSASLNPGDSQTWTMLGLATEAAGRPEQAERYLLEASKRNQGYEPRWILANFYFRRHDTEKFWSWARQAASWSYSAPEALARLCWRMSPDAAEILRRLEPCPCNTARSLLAYLSAANPSAAEPLAMHLMACREPLVTTELLDYTSTLILHDQPEAALRVWNPMAAGRLVPYPPLDPQAGVSLTNGDFAHPLLLRGFDWRVEHVPGISGVRLSAPAAFELTFDGQQPEAATVLYQALILEPGKEYRLKVDVTSQGLASPSGLRWRLVDFHTGAPMSADSPDLLDNLPWKFRSATSGRMPFLALVYIRPAGALPFRGTVHLEHGRLAQGKGD